MSLKTWIFNSPGKKKLSLKRGIYRFECWGASGGSLVLDSSSGSYVSGIISLHSLMNFYLFIGEKGTPNNTTVTFNGGGAAFISPDVSGIVKASHGSSGGGATDIRLKDGDWNDLESLKSRIIVASGGGGETRYKNSDLSKAARGGNGGSIIGEKSSYSQCYGCTVSAYTQAGSGEQEKGGQGGGVSDYCWGDAGSFGVGASAKFAKEGWPSSGGGSGYFWGGSGGVSHDCLGSGAGGSSFVSGCKDCSAISSNFTIENTFFSGNVHYSGLSFRRIVMKDGSLVNRHSMNGQIKITFLSSLTQKYDQHRGAKFFSSEDSYLIF